MAVTPMMQQYFSIKEQYKDYILFYRLGDFYEMFYDDAVTASRELELVLTGRDCGEEERAPMCGIPYHSCESYIGRLIEKGYKIAICEQTEDPAKAKGLVRREVIRIVTPGTLIESELLPEQKNNYLCTVYAGGADNSGIGVCFADVSTGEMFATTVENEAELRNELASYSPREVVLDVPARALPEVSSFVRERISAAFEDGQAPYFEPDEAHRAVAERFPNESGDGEGNNAPYAAAVIAAGAALIYIAKTQMRPSAQMSELHYYSSAQFLEMDVSTRRNLELTETMLRKEKRGSLWWVLDNTVTSAGARLLRRWVERPLVSTQAIRRRQGAVAALVDDIALREDLASLLDGTLDLERLITKAVYATANAKDLKAVSATLAVIPEVLRLLASAPDEELLAIYAALSADVEATETVRAAIDAAITDDPPFSVREGGIIKAGFSVEVDELRSIMSDGHGWIERIENAEKEATGIKNLRIGYNRVFGYYIEVTKSQVGSVPERYIRKQTLSNCERYITEELKDHEATILGAADKLNSLEYELFCQVVATVAEKADAVQRAAAQLAKLDVYQSLARAAVKNNYVCPEVDDSDVIEIRDGRHPVVERFVTDNYFVPNDTLLDTGANRLMLITGPNMAGKSTYMRQTALIAIMAQIGSFVPAKEARIGVLDRVFTRVGASDDLASGQSTFMLEMTEVAYILAHATRRSLIIYDEIGRGTSTFDGMAIARAVAEYTAGKKIGAKTMFATHYHELTELEGQLDGVVNYNIAAKKRGGTITFLRKIIRGATDDSYGIDVAKLAGVPAEVVKRARDILSEIESGSSISMSGTRRDAPKDDAPSCGTLPMETLAESAVAEKLKSVDLNTLTPLEAMNLLFELKKLLI